MIGVFPPCLQREWKKSFFVFVAHLKMPTNYLSFYEHRLWFIFHEVSQKSRILSFTCNRPINAVIASWKLHLIKTPRQDGISLFIKTFLNAGLCYRLTKIEMLIGTIFSALTEWELSIPRILFQQTEFISYWTLALK